MPPSTLTAGGTSAASAIELDDDEGNAADESRYRIKKKKPAAVQPKIEGATHHGFIIAYTTAKIHGLQGVCLAVYDERTCAIRRLCSQHSESSPFWDRALVADLRLGAAIEYKISPEPPQTEFPHKTEDVYAVELQRRPAPALLHRDCIRLLEPLAATALSATWPDHLRADEKRPCVLSGARVPSLAVFRGCVTAFDKESGLACLRIQCGTELTRIKVNCNREQALLRSGHGANEESLLLLGLARARPPSTTCLILLVSRTPLQALRPALAPAVEQPRAQSSVHVAAANGKAPVLPNKAAPAPSKRRRQDAPGEPISTKRPKEAFSASASSSASASASASAPASASTPVPVRRRVRAFAIGTKVVIGRGDADRVVSQPELNGKSGVVISFDEAKGRYVVRVRMDTSLSKKDISLKPDVLDGLTSDGVSYVWAGGAVSDVPTAERTAPAYAQAEALAGVGEDRAASEPRLEQEAEEEEDDDVEDEEDDVEDEEDSGVAGRMAADEQMEEAFGNDSLEVEEEEEPMGEALVGCRVRVWWLGDGDDIFYDGQVKSFSRKRGHCVVYDDGETKWHTFDDDDEIWKVLA